ncbi:MAG: endonuclease/exonuclease/phosphatase family protein [Terricaulis sp.]
MRVATFNVQNLRLRDDPNGAHFDGARDEIKPLSKLSAKERAEDGRDRLLTARLMADANADVIALQEVFDQRTLDAFHDQHLAPLGCHYPYRVCVPGNDGQRHVAFMSRTPLAEVTSHAALTYADIELEPPAGVCSSDRVFRRDCLIAITHGVLLLNVHFKAPVDAESLAVVQFEAQAVRKIIERRFANSAAAAWLVLGDVNVNDVTGVDAIGALTDGFASDLALQRPAADRWTYFHAGYGSYARPDRMLASPALAQQCRSFEVRREGMSIAADTGKRLAGVGEVRPRASDHAMLLATLKI